MTWGLDYERKGGGKMRDPGNEGGIVIYKCDAMQEDKTGIFIFRARDILSTENSVFLRETWLKNSCFSKSQVGVCAK